jgi:hypothetical protein
LAKAFNFKDELFALTIEPLKRLYVKHKTPMCKAFSGCFNIFAEISDFEHPRILEQTGGQQK